MCRESCFEGGNLPIGLISERPRPRPLSLGDFQTHGDSILAYLTMGWRTFDRKRDRLTLRVAELGFRRNTLLTNSRLSRLVAVIGYNPANCGRPRGADQLCNARINLPSTCPVTGRL